jgi:hypothetical protein
VGAASDLSVSNGQANFRTPTGDGGERNVILRSSWVKNVDLRAKLTLSAPSGSGAAYGFITARRQADGKHVRIGLRVTATGNVQIRGQLQSGVNLFADTDTGMQFSAGTAYQLRVQLQDNTIRVKAWRSGATEPTSWRVVQTSTAMPQLAGVFGLRTVNYSSSTVTVRADDFSAATIPTATASAASFSAKRKVAKKGRKNASVTLKGRKNTKLAALGRKNS